MSHIARGEWFAAGSEFRRADPAGRGVQYGDGLFETIAVRNGMPRLLRYHLERLTTGCERLGLAAPGAALSQALEGEGIGVNVVFPGRASTDMTRSRRLARPPRKSPEPDKRAAATARAMSCWNEIASMPQRAAPPSMCWTQTPASGVHRL